jgi:hypothetical protein
MKHLSVAGVVAFGVALSASANGADRLRAHYEINVKVTGAIALSAIRQ